MDFQIVGSIIEVEVIAQGTSIREVSRLRRAYGAGHWRKLKGTARIQFSDGAIATAEILYYEAHGIGRGELKIKRFLDEET